MPAMQWLAYLDAMSRFVFVNWALQSCCVLAAALLIARLPRVSPAVRHGVLAAGLFLAMAAPAAQLIPLPRRVEVRTPSASRLAIERLRWSVVPLAAWTSARPAPTARSGGTTPAPPCCSFSPASLAGCVLLLTWAAIAAARLILLAHGSWCVRRWLLAATPIEPRMLHDICGYTPRLAPVLDSARVGVPCVMGACRPTIVLPAGLTQSLPAADLRHVLLHEEAHARRNDPLFFLLAGVGHAVLFWNPLAGMVRRRMERAAEDACDTDVVARTQDEVGYARTLLAVLEHTGSVALRRGTCPLGQSGSELKRRVTRILGGTPRPSPAAALVASGALVGLSAAAGTAQLGAAPRLPAGTGPRIAMSPAVRRLAASTPRVQSVPGGPAPTAPPQPVAAPEPVTHTVAVPRPEAADPQPEPMHVNAGAALAVVRSTPPRVTRTIVFVLDNSSSMRVYQPAARREILRTARSLAPTDAFNVIAFASETWSFSREAVPPTDVSLDALQQWFASLPEASGSNISAGLECAFRLPDVGTVVLITDGDASQGAVGQDQLVAFVTHENTSGARVIAISPGPANRSENEAVLSAIATKSHGEVRVIDTEAESPQDQ